MTEALSVALFDHFPDARTAVDDLIRGGIPADRIGLFTNNAAGDHPRALLNPALDRPIAEEPEAPTNPGVGAALGAGMGGVLGFLVNALALAIPGVGPVLAVGAWATIAGGAGLGAIAGAIISSLSERGVSDEDAQLYAEGLRRGGTLVTVHADERDIENIARIFHRHGAVDIEKRSASWRAEGWTGFQPEAQPLSATEVAAMRQLHRDAGHEALHHHAIRHYFVTTEPEHLAGISSRPRYGDDLLKR